MLILNTLFDILYYPPMFSKLDIAIDQNISV